MRGRSHRRERHVPSDAPQLVLRALVGSFFVCAALVSPALAQQPTSGASDVQREAETASVPRVSFAPFRSLIARAVRLRDEGSISADDVFDFEIEADRADDGTLANVRFAGEAAVNGHWHSLVQDFLAALSRSRALSVLRDARHLSMRLKSDPRDFLASLSFEAPTAERARQIADGYDLLLHLASANPRGANSAALLAGAKVSASGKQFTAKLEMSREQLGNLLSQSLAIP
ncbi:MAG: hypothetical protein M3268_06360 [Acidobacteriota bacterium]|nr:hypothetical protein [Acidobacteriota bacterium]